MLVFGDIHKMFALKMLDFTWACVLELYCPHAEQKARYDFMFMSVVWNDMELRALVHLCAR